MARDATRGKFRSLEGLRGVLALLVCCGHLGLVTVAQRAGLVVRFGLAVDVFFALSGFVLCHSSYFGRRTVGEFTVARLARLYPLHCLTAAAVLAMGPARGIHATPAEVLQHLTLTHNVGLPPNHLSLDMPAWSISVEFWIGLLFCALMTSRARRWPWLLLTAIALPIAVSELTRSDAQNVLRVVNIGLLRAVAAFSVGILAYLASERCADRVSIPRAVPYALGAALAVMLTLPWWSAAATLMFYAIVFLLLVALTSSNDDATILCARPFVWLGTVSYSVYLLHMPIYYALELAVGERLLARGGKFVVVAIVLAASAQSHRWIEVPFQRAIRERFARRPRLRGAEPIASPA